MISFCPKFLQFFRLYFTLLGIYLEQIGGRRFFHGVSVDPDIYALVGLYFFLKTIGAILNFFLDVAILYGLQGAAHGVNLFYVIINFSLNSISKSFHIVRARQRINGVSSAALLGDNLLGSEGNSYRLLSGKTQRFIIGVGVQRLSTTVRCGQRL